MRKPKPKNSTQEQVFLSSPALPLEQCIAKTRIGSANSVPTAGRTVEEHCRIVGAVARVLLQRMPHAQQVLFSEHAHVPALVHDIGKICPTFQEKLYRAMGFPNNSLPELRTAQPDLELTWGKHAAVSYAALSPYKNAHATGEIVGQHHGSPTQQRPADCEIFGGAVWQEQREVLLHRLLNAESLDTPDIWPISKSPEQTRLMAGLTIVADWIGSGERFENPHEDWTSLVEGAVDAAGFIPLSLHHHLSFEDIFTFPPLKAQSLFYEQVKSPGIYILEAPMGLGKTEAALYAAYQMLDKGLSTGVYFALPTQLTSNRMHARFESFLGKILMDDRHALLLHGKAWLERFSMQEMGEKAAPSGSWFHGSKRGLLAPFAVGTVDQALMAAMHVRHSAVRAFGLAGKTVILDEVHSYDAYTGVILEELVALLRHFGCTVIILSATLTADRRSKFTGQSSQKNSYPLISACRIHDNNFEEIDCPQALTAEVLLNHCSNDALAMEEALLRAEQGQQVLWIENTVAEAQGRFRLLAARASSMDIETGLIHSRFTAVDRTKNESHWVTLYGKAAPSRHNKGRILIGTQVLEQSLDIDADFLVSRFCPTDMLLQRLGRLWRHATTVRPSEAKREAWLLHPALCEVLENPERAFGNSGYVYAPYVLYRSLEIWEQLSSISLPSHIRPLLEATYTDRIENNEAIIRTFQKLEQECATLRGLALRGISTNTSVLAEHEAKTRAGERPEVDVILFRSINHTTGIMELADETIINLSPLQRHTWREKQAIAARLALNTVRVPEYRAPNTSLHFARKWISPWIYCGKYGEAICFGVIQADDKIYDVGGQAIGKKALQYRKDYGYMVE